MPTPKTLFYDFWTIANKIAISQFSLNLFEEKGISGGELLSIIFIFWKGTRNKYFLSNEPLVKSIHQILKPSCKFYSCKIHILHLQNTALVTHGKLSTAHRHVSFRTSSVRCYRVFSSMITRRNRITYQIETRK